MKQRLVTVLHPNFKPFPRGLSGGREYPTLNDYIEVPYLDTIGGWRMRDLLTHAEIKALADLANSLERKNSHKVRTGLREETVRWRA